MPDDFYWINKFTTIAGTWTDSGLGGAWYQTSDTIAAIASNVAAVVDQFVSSSTIGITPDGTGDSNWRFGIGADTNNYLFVEFFLDFVGGFLDQYILYFRLGKREASVDSYFMPAQLVAGVFNNGTGSLLQIPFALSLDVDGCLNYHPQLNPSVGTTTITTVRNVTSLGGNVGFFLSPLRGTFRFTNLRFTHAYGPSTPSCTRVMQSCSRGFSQEDLTLTIADSTPSSYSYSYLFAPCECIFDCGAFIGSWIVNRLPVGADDGVNVCSYLSAHVVNDYSTKGAWVDPPCPAASDCPTTTGVWVDFTMGSTGDTAQDLDGSRTLTASLWFQAVDGSTAIVQLATFSQTYTSAQLDAMEDWTVGTDFDIAELGTTLCNTSANLTAKIKRHV